MNRAKIIADARAKEIYADNRQYVWMSFCDRDMPAGEQFLGVIITKAYGPADAMCKTHELGINPGGEIQSYACSLAYGKRYGGNTDRLIREAELQELNYI